MPNESRCARQIPSLLEQPPTPPPRRTSREDIGGGATLRRKYNPDRSLNVDQDNLWVRPFSRFPRRVLLNNRHRFPYFTKQLEWRHSTRFSRKLALFCRSPERSRGGSLQVGRPTTDAILTRNLRYHVSPLTYRVTIELGQSWQHLVL